MGGGALKYFYPIDKFSSKKHLPLWSTPYKRTLICWILTGSMWNLWWPIRRPCQGPPGWRKVNVVMPRDWLTKWRTKRFIEKFTLKKFDIYIESKDYFCKTENINLPFESMLATARSTQKNVHWYAGQNGGCLQHAPVKKHPWSMFGKVVGRFEFNST